MASGERLMASMWRVAIPLSVVLHAAALVTAAMLAPRDASWPIITIDLTADAPAPPAAAPAAATTHARSRTSTSRGIRPPSTSTSGRLRSEPAARTSSGVDRMPGVVASSPPPAIDVELPVQPEPNLAPARSPAPTSTEPIVGDERRVSDRSSLATPAVPALSSDVGSGESKAIGTRATSARGDQLGGGGGQRPSGNSSARGTGSAPGGDTGYASARAPGSGDGSDADWREYLSGVTRRLQESLRYPPSARRRGVTGTVQIELVIQPNGVVSDAVVVRSSSHPVLDEAALDAVRSLPSIPFPRGLPPRILRATLPVTFRLN